MGMGRMEEPMLANGAIVLPQDESRKPTVESNLKKLLHMRAEALFLMAVN